MKKLTGIAMFAAIIASGPALAQDAGTDSYYYSDVLPIVYAQNVPDFSSITESDTIEVVAMSEVADVSPENEALLDAAMSERNPSELHESVGGNAALTAALEAEDFTVEQVVAVAREEEGERYVIYVDDRS